MKKYPTVKIAFLELNKVVSLNIIEAEAVEAIKLFLVGSYSKKSEFSISSYVETLVSFLLVNGENYVKYYQSQDEDTRLQFLFLCYSGIVTYYPEFHLSKLLNKLNEEAFKKFPGKKIPAPRFVEDPEDELRELVSANLAGESDMPKKTERLINTKEEIEQLEKFLRENIVGQDEAISSIVKGTKLICTGFSSSLSFFFLGPTGVGKTQLAKLFAEKYCGRVYKIDCGEYSGGHEFHKLIGSPPGYIGHSDSNILKTKAKESNTWVFIFDEIEKASPKFFDFLLSWIEDGFVTDNNGNELDFSNSILIFTSNEGVQDLKIDRGLGFSDSVTYDNSHEEILKSVEKKFSPEFRNRLDFIIFFNSLKKVDIDKIAQLELEKDIPINITQDVIDFIVKNSYSPKYGARELQRFIRNNISLKVAEAQLEKLVPKDGKPYYDVEIRDNECYIVNTEEYKKDVDSSTKKTTRRGTGATKKTGARKRGRPPKSESDRKDDSGPKKETAEKK